MLPQKLYHISLYYSHLLEVGSVVPLISGEGNIIKGRLDGIDRLNKFVCGSTSGLYPSSHISHENIFFRTTLLSHQ